MKCPDCGADRLPYRQTSLKGIVWKCGSQSLGHGIRTERCKYVAGLRAIVEPLEELTADKHEAVTIQCPRALGAEVIVVTGPTGQTETFTGSTLAEALAEADNARKESES